ncbi:MAG: hypothetical protein ISS47_04320 [Candidatus Omnitrophica bacterium]|nr:hypothetical protein [Candidatus Omnitrophota bacterium]
MKKLTNQELQNIKYFFSLALEDYFGDKEEIMQMADINEDLIEQYFAEETSVV